MSARCVLVLLLLRLRAVTPGHGLAIGYCQCQRLADALDAIMRGR